MIPFARLTTVFLDVGNTLVSVDFDRIATELAALGHACRPDALRRAEAASRPVLSAALASSQASTEGEPGLVRRLRLVLERVPAFAEVDDRELRRVAEALLPVLHQPGHADRIWRSVLPGVPDALERLVGSGVELAVVSNADGSVERGLATAGLRHHFHHVLDSAVVGFEKPDPRIFQEALRRTGAEPERALHVGDLLHADVTGARAAGIHAALLDPFGDWTDVDCPVYRDLGALADALCEARSRA